jgi:hypothetical protein
MITVKIILIALLFLASPFIIYVSFYMMGAGLTDGIISTLFKRKKSEKNGKEKTE